VKTVDLNAIIKRSEQLLGRVIGEDIEFRTRRSEKELSVLADVVQIEQVLMNLAANARDAMPNGGTLLIETEEVTLGEDFIRANSYGRPGKFACLSVTDTGIGMDENTRPRIFEPFFTTKEVGKGRTRSLDGIRHHKAARRLYQCFQRTRKGTTFKIYFPDRRSSRRNRGPAHAEIARGTETVLIAEDDKTVRDLTRYILEGRATVVGSR
jgi:signal transduction histidine kinase